MKKKSNYIELNKNKKTPRILALAKKAITYHLTSMNALMQNYRFLLNQIASLRGYVYSIVIFILFSYSIYLLYDVDTIIMLSREDGFFECLTAICFLTTSVLSLIIFIKNKNIFFLLLSLIFFFGAGEEISWGQRILDFDTPSLVQKMNVQNEFNLHNLELFHMRSFDGTTKQGLAKLITVNFLYKLFWLFWCVFLPILVYNFEFLKKLTLKLKIPIPALAIGIFFIVNWVMYKTILTLLLALDENRPYNHYIGEIRESISSFIFLILMLYFYHKLRSHYKLENVP